MKIKYLKNLSFFFSILLLFIFTILFILTLIISYKPIKLNFTNYFDRESKTFKKIDIKEIGDIYLSFNKSSKNFELLIEDLLIEETYLPSTLISLDFTFSENIFDTSIKIFDAEITLRDESKFDNLSVDEKTLEDFFSDKLTFLQYFNVIEIINSKILLFVNDNFAQKYLVDLNFKNNFEFILLRELSSIDNFVTVNLDFSDNFLFNFKANNFNIDLISLFSPRNFFIFDNLRVTGESSLEISRNSKIESFDYNLFLNGKVSYETNFSKKLLSCLANNDSDLESKISQSGSLKQTDDLTEKPNQTISSSILNALSFVQHKDKPILLNLNELEEVKSSNIDYTKLTKIYLNSDISAGKNLNVKITKLAHGLPVGSEIEYLDDGTLFSAFKYRNSFNNKN